MAKALVNKNYEQLTAFLASKATYERTLSKDGSNTTESVLSYPLKRVAEKIKSVIKKPDLNYQRKINELYVKHASVDSDQNLMKDADGNYKYTPEKQLELNKQLESLSDKYLETVFEIESYIVADFPIEKLSYLEQVNFAGFVIPERVEEAE